MVIHQAEQQRFIIEQDGHECVLDYVVEGKQIDFTHTYVPFRLRGKGLAEELVNWPGQRVRVMTFRPVAGMCESFSDYFAENPRV